MSIDGMSTDSISTSASIYCGIKPVYVGPGERYSFPFASAAAAIAAAAATAAAIVRARVWAWA